MNEPHTFRNIVWIGSSRKDLQSFPDEVKDVIGYALYQAQLGRKAPSATPLTGFGGASVIEIADDYQRDTFRVVYTVRFSNLLYVLHAFQKKSKKGIATPKHHIDLIKKRFSVAQEDYRMRQQGQM
jgi:phage-related protein